MNVPPLCTVAVRAKVQAPSPRLPRKYPVMNDPRLTTRWATVPSQTEAATNTNSATSVPAPADGSSMRCLVAGESFLIVRQFFSKVGVGHEDESEPPGKSHAHGPR